MPTLDPAVPVCNPSAAQAAGILALLSRRTSVEDPLLQRALQAIEVGSPVTIRYLPEPGKSDSRGVSIPAFWSFLQSFTAKDVGRIHSDNFWELDAANPGDAAFAECWGRNLNLSAVRAALVADLLSPRLLAAFLVLFGANPTFFEAGEGTELWYAVVSGITYANVDEIRALLAGKPDILLSLEITLLARMAAV